jgi:N-acyl-L-homoserine lactone synthetase
MHAIAVTPETYRAFRPSIDAMHQLRARVFHERLGWDVEVVNGREFDEFDRNRPTYILAISEDGSVVGSVRLLPATGPTLLSVLFPELRPSGLFCPHTAMIESSRFCVDTTFEAKRGGQAIHDTTWTMFAGIIEWSIANGYSELITVTDVRIERILRRAGWPMARIGQPKTIGNTTAVVGLLPTDQPSFERVRPEGYSSEIRSFVRAA